MKFVRYFSNFAPFPKNELNPSFLRYRLTSKKQIAPDTFTLRYQFPEEIKKELAIIRSKVGKKVFGVDLVLPPGMPEFNSRDEIEAEIPEAHKRFVEER